MLRKAVYRSTRVVGNAFSNGHRLSSSEAFRLIAQPFNSVLAEPVESWEEVTTHSFHETDKRTTWAHALVAQARDNSAIWAEVPLTHARHAETLRLAGFNAHGIFNEKIRMYRWLDDGLEDRVPAAPHTQVAVGGIVVHRPTGTLLVVKEHGKRTSWKLPGGVLDKGESIGACAEREILEETGVRARFSSVLGFRHLPELGPQLLADVYFIALLELLQPIENGSTGGDGVALWSSQTPPGLSLCRHEIQEARWMPPKELASASSHPMTRFNASMAAACIKARAEDPTGDGAAPFEMLGHRMHGVPGRPPFRYYAAAAAGSPHTDS